MFIIVSPLLSPFLTFKTHDSIAPVPSESYPFKPGTRQARTHGNHYWMAVNQLAAEELTPSLIWTFKSTYLLPILLLCPICEFNQSGKSKIAPDWQILGFPWSLAI